MNRWEKRRGWRHPGMVGKSGSRQIRRPEILGAKSLIPGVIRPEESFVLNTFRIRQREKSRRRVPRSALDAAVPDKGISRITASRRRNTFRYFPYLGTGVEILH